MNDNTNDMIELLRVQLESANREKELLRLENENLKNKIRVMEMMAKQAEQQINTIIGNFHPTNFNVT